jgi:hypothetical protein
LNFGQYLASLGGVTPPPEDPNPYRAKRIGFDRKHLTKTTVVPHEKDGRHAGSHTEHRDGRVDATVTPRPVVISTRTQE